MLQLVVIVELILNVFEFESFPQYCFSFVIIQHHSFLFQHSEVVVVDSAAVDSAADAAVFDLDLDVVVVDVAAAVTADVVAFADAVVVTVDDVVVVLVRMP